MSENIKIAAITGPGGLTGTYLAKFLLQKDYKVRMLVRTERAKREILDFLNNQNIDNYTKNKIEFYNGDICNFKDINKLAKNVDYLFHNAAFVSFNPNKKNQIFKTNITGTRNVVNAVIENQKTKLIYFSSIAALGNPTNNKIINEECFYFENNNNPYSESKYYAELEIWRGINEGIKAAIINPAVVLGYSKTGRSSSALLTQMAYGVPFVPDGITGFVDVEDVCRAAVLLAESSITGQRFILCAENISYIDFFKKVKKTISSKAKPYLINKNVILTLAHIIQFFAGIFNREPLIAPPMIKSSLSKKQYDGSLICKTIEEFEYTPILKTLEKWHNHTKNNYETVNSNQ